jgi:hypothetical protein
MLLRRMWGLSLAVSIVFGTRLLDSAENWPQWRGPDGNGISDSVGLPHEWSLERNVAWKSPLPSWSGGTPVVWGDRVFVTSPSKPDPNQAAADAEETPQPQRRDDSGRPQGQGRGRRGFGRGGFGGRFGPRRDPGGSTLLLICISKIDGTQLWQRELGEGNRLWMKQNASSPSPVTDGVHVWAVTGTGAVAAFDLNGNPIWQRNLQEDYGRFGLNWGYASSPMLYNGKLIIEVLHGNNTDDPSYVVALDGPTGEEVWRRERPTDAERESPDAYTTPILYSEADRQYFVINGGDYVTGHDAETGDELWRAAGLNPRGAGNFRIIASPVVADGIIYAPTRQKPLLALRTGGTGDVTESHLAWKWDDDAGPDVPTPVCDGKLFYMVNDRGLATCLDAKTGTVVWGPKRTASGTISASPLLADGKLYITNENGVTTVITAGPDSEQLAINELDGSYTLSSIAVSGQELFLRTSTHLYCIANQPSG